MKATQARLNPASLKTRLVLTCIIVGFFSFGHCTAQSVIGKWKRTFLKVYITDKATGKQVPASPDQQRIFDEHTKGYNETLELKPDNTYVSTVSTAGEDKPQVHNGAYTLTGKTLEMNIPLVHNERTTITLQSLDASTMTWELVFMKRKSEIVYTRIK